MTIATALTHLGAAQPFRTTTHLKTSLKPCMTAIRRKISPAQGKIFSGSSNLRLRERAAGNLKPDCTPAEEEKA
jgi:hypothetical protein